MKLSLSIRALSIYGLLAVAFILSRLLSSSPQERPPHHMAAKTQIAAFMTALDAFKKDNGFYPRQADGLTALIRAPLWTTNWQGPYLMTESAIPPDPWGTPYQYVCPGVHNNSSYDIISAGPDRKFQTPDDIGNW